MLHNPAIAKWVSQVDWLGLEADLLNYLLDHAGQPDQRIDEYTLIQWLEARSVFTSLDIESATLQLFVKHFTLRRCLYSLRCSLYERGYQIKFGLIHFEIQANNLSERSVLKGSGVVVASDQLIAGFYGDLNTLLSATEDGVNKLLADFWVKYDSYQQADSAYQILGISVDATWPQIQQAYRNLASVHHPDKGGTPENFVAIKGAYDQLKILKSAK